MRACRQVRSQSSGKCAAPRPTRDTARRYGYDSCGEAVLCCSAQTAALGQQLVASGSHTTVASVLGAEMRRFLLEMACCCAARDDGAAPSAVRRDCCRDVRLDELQSIARTSLHARCRTHLLAADGASAADAAEALDKVVIEQLQLLRASALVATGASAAFIRPTAEGAAVFLSGISLAAAAHLSLDFCGAGLSSGGEELLLLHALVPPTSSALPRFDWRVLHDSVWPQLQPRAIAAAAALRVEERSL